MNIHRLLVHLIHVLDVGLQHRSMNMRQNGMFLISGVNTCIEVLGLDGPGVGGFHIRDCGLELCADADNLRYNHLA